MITDGHGPYLNCAVICEKVLQEQNGTISLIRIIDRMTVTVSTLGTPANMFPVPINNLNVFISLRSGEAKGRNTVKLRIETPSGVRLPEQLLPVLFEGEDRGVNLILNLNIVADQEGLYWFDILLEDQLLTRIPLRIVYQRMGQNV